MVEMVSSRPMPAKVSNRALRYALVAIGSLSVVVGVIGIFVPLLPTTVFLLIAAACFGRSSSSAYNWLTTNRLFGKYLRDYQEEKGATVLSKVISIGGLWISIGATIYFMGLPLWISVGLLLIAGAVSVHLLRLKTIR